MGRRGPPPKPTALRLLEGNPSKRAINAAEPMPTPNAPKMPTWLDRAARLEWRTIVPELASLGLLTVVDRAVLASYCQSYSNLQSAQKVLKIKGMVIKAPSGYPMPRPEVAISHKERLLLKAYCQELGLTPSARSRMSVNEGKEPQTLEEMLA